MLNENAAKYNRLYYPICAEIDMPDGSLSEVWFNGVYRENWYKTDENVQWVPELRAASFYAEKRMPFTQAVRFLGEKLNGGKVSRVFVDKGNAQTAFDYQKLTA